MMEAELADGRILEFPDGTDPTVIQGTVKRVLKGTGEGIGGLPMPVNVQSPRPGFGAHETMEALQEREAGVDYLSGTPNAIFRAGFSRMDTEEERAAYLDKFAGSGNWRVDNYGKHLLKPEGRKRLGLPSADKETAIDEQSLSRYDIADVAGAAPSMIGAIGGGMRASPYGIIPGLAASSIGAAGGKLIDEAVEWAQGYQRQGAGEVLSEAAGEGVAAGGGEGVVRGLRPIGRKILGPATTRQFSWFDKQPPLQSTVDPARLKLTDEALKMGARPSIAQASDRPIIGRAERMLDTIFGDPRAVRNRDAIMKRMKELIEGAAKGPPAVTTPSTVGRQAQEAITREQANLRAVSDASMKRVDALLAETRGKISGRLGQAMERGETGEEVIRNLREAHGVFKEAAGARYANFDRMIGKKPVVPTADLKNQAVIIERTAPKTEDGKISVFLSPETRKFLAGIQELPELITAQQLNFIRTTLREAAYDHEMLKGVGKYHVARLREAADKSIDRIASERGLGGIPMAQRRSALKYLDETRSWYAENISKFDNVYIGKLTRDAKSGGAIDPDDVMNFIVKPGNPRRVKMVKNLVPPETWKKVESRLFDDMQERATDLTGEFNSAILNREINKLGSTLDSVYGREAGKIRLWAKELAARNGKIDPSDLGKGDFARVLGRAVERQKQTDAFDAQSMVKEWTAGNFDPGKAALSLMRPNNSKMISQAKNILGENSREFLELRELSMEQLLKRTISNTDDPVKAVLSGAPLKKAMEEIGDDSLRAMFGPALTSELKQFANVTHFLTQSKTAVSGGLVAANIALHPVANLGILAKLFAFRKLLATEGAIKYFTHGLKAPGTRTATEGMSRVVSQIVSQIPESHKAGGLDFGYGAEE